MSSKKLDRSGTVRRLIKALVRRDRSAVLDGLEDMIVRVVRPIDAVTEAAMWKSGKVGSRTVRRALRRHLRHHFGRDIFISEKVVMALNEGHVPVRTCTVKYDTGDDEKLETIKYSGKDVARISRRPSREPTTYLPRLMKQSKLRRVHGDNLATASSHSCSLG